MLDTNGNVLRPNTRVKLLKPDPKYHIGAGNPAVGTKYECAGVYKPPFHVDWENGTGNGYKDYELLNIDDPCVSIWEN